MSKLIGPFQVELKVHVRNDATRQSAVVTYTLPPGRLPMLEDIHAALGASLAGIPDGFRLLDSHDFFNRILVKEKTGRIGNFAVSPEFDYDVEALTASARAAYVPKAKKSPRRQRHEEEE